MPCAGQLILRYNQDTERVSVLQAPDDIEISNLMYLMIVSGTMMVRDIRGGEGVIAITASDGITYRYKLTERCASCGINNWHAKRIHL